MEFCFGSISKKRMNKEDSAICFEIRIPENYCGTIPSKFMEMMLDIWLWLHLRWRYQITETQYCVFAAIVAINAIPM